MVDNKDYPKVAILGTGYWGRNLVRNFHGLGALKTVADANPDTLSGILDQYPGLFGASSLDEILADPQIKGVILATPAPAHAEQAIRVLKSGRDVLVEKPLALSMDDADTIVRLARENNLILMVDHLLNRHPAIGRLKELISDGELGRICHVYSRRMNFGKLRHKENALWSLAPHDISMILNLLEDSPVSVSAFGGDFLTHGVEDVVEADMKFLGGLTAHISVSWLNPYKEQRLVVAGLEKMAVFDDTLPWSDKLVIYPHKVKWHGVIPESVAGGVEKIALVQNEPLREQCLVFLEAIKTRKEPFDSHGDEALKVLSVLTSMDRSLVEGRVQVLSPRGDERAFSVHPSAVVDPGVTIGAGSRIWHFSHVMSGTVLGPDCNIGQNVVVGPRVKVGRGCKIQNNVSVYEGVTLEDDVFCGPSMVFTNVNNPRAFVRRMSEMRPTLVRRGASIGANATIVCGHTLGEYCFIAAGSVVTTDVPAYAAMRGVPARRTGWICRCGEKLSEDLVCPVCRRKYSEESEGLVSEPTDD